MRRSPVIKRLVRACLGLLLLGLTTLGATAAEPRRLLLPNARKAGGTPGVIQDNWLPTFNDEQLNALVREAVTNNPDLRVSTTRIEQAGQYVELAKAAMRSRVAIAGTGGFKGGGGSDVSSALQGIMLAVSW